MQKKSIWMLCALLIGALIFVSGCKEDTTEIEEGVNHEIIDVGYCFLEEKFETSPDRVAVITYEIDPAETFRVINMEDDAAVIRGRYQCTYGWSPQKPILEMSVTADLQMRQNSQGDWRVESITPVKVKSNAESKGKGWITSLDESRNIPFISDKEAGDRGLGITGVANDLLSKWMMEFSNYEGEKATFMLIEASSEASNLEQIEISQNRSDVKRCWKIKDGVVGVYLGYIEGLGYASSMLQMDFGDKRMVLNQKPLYLVKKQDGYYLESSAVFEETVTGKT